MKLTKVNDKKPTLYQCEHDIEICPFCSNEILKNQEKVLQLQSDNQALKYERVDLLNRCKTLQKKAEKWNKFKADNKDQSISVDGNEFYENLKIVERLKKEFLPYLIEKGYWETKRELEKILEINA